MVAFRVNGEEMAALRAAASRCGLNVSDYMRSLCSAALVQVPGERPQVTA